MELDTGSSRNVERLERVARLSTLDHKRQELHMAERMREYAQGWMDRLHHDIADLEAEEHRP